jgi:hypothetical protein
MTGSIRFGMDKSPVPGFAGAGDSVCLSIAIGDCRRRTQGTADCVKKPAATGKIDASQ